MPLIVCKGRTRVERKREAEAEELECPQAIREPEPRWHECGICHAEWLCGFSKCPEPEWPVLTECRKCKCGLPECGLMGGPDGTSVL